MNKRKICAITGSRSEYGLLRPVMRRITLSSKLSLQLIVTGMHMSKTFGNTISDIISDGFSIDEKVIMTSKRDDAFGMAESVGSGILGITRSLSRLNPDIVLVLGDRVEALAGTIAAAYGGIPVAHIHGGDVTKGGLDESARHAITKFSHIHFPAILTSAQRIEKLGEDSWRIFTVGAPGIDELADMQYLSKDELEKEYNINSNKSSLLLIQHPVTTEINEAAEQMKTTLKAVEKMGLQTIIVFPNADAGGREMIKIIKKYVNKNPLLHAYPSLPRRNYLSLLKYVSILIGNSSSGIIEAAYFRKPVIDIGIRQEGREQSTNILHTNHRIKEIEEAITTVLCDKKFIQQVQRSRNIYGNGTASKKIVDILSSITIDKKLLQKKITY